MTETRDLNGVSVHPLEADPPDRQWLCIEVILAIIVIVRAQNVGDSSFTAE
jgi:hypothetical protein